MLELEIAILTSGCCYLLRNAIIDVITLRYLTVSYCKDYIIFTNCGLSILLHGAILLHDATSFDKMGLFT